MQNKKGIAKKAGSIFLALMFLCTFLPLTLFASPEMSPDGRYRFSAHDACSENIADIYGVELLVCSQASSYVFRMNVNADVENLTNNINFCSQDVAYLLGGAHVVELVPGEWTPVTYLSEQPLFGAEASLATVGIMAAYGDGVEVAQVTWLDADGNTLGVSVDTVEPAVPALPAEEEFLFLLLGDSIPEGAGLDDAATQGYGALVSGQMGYFLQNLAIGGDTSEDLRAIVENWHWYFETIQRADAIVFSIGGNDFLRDIATLLIQLTLNNYTKMNEILVELEDNLTAILDALRALNPDAPVLVQTLYNPQSISLTRRTYQKGLDLLNPMIVSLVEGYENMYIVELEQPFAEAYSAGNRGLIQSDMTHPTAEGHALIAEKIVETLYANGLVTDFSDLQALIDQAQDVDSALYTPASAAQLEAALATANTVAGSARSMQADVDAAAEALAAALEGLCPRADTAALAAIVAEAEALDAADYTPESWEPLALALDAAYALLADENAAQADVDATEEALRGAMEGLVSSYVPVASLTVENGYSLTMYEHDTLQLVVRINPEEATNMDLIFSSTNEAVCTVNEDGLLTATGYGTTRVTIAAADGVSVTITVRVL